MTTSDVVRRDAVLGGMAACESVRGQTGRSVRFGTLVGAAAAGAISAGDTTEHRRERRTHHTADERTTN